MRRILTILILMLAAGSAQAATYYVNVTGGDDSRTTAQAANPATPWLTLTGAEAKATAGDTIHVAAGTYVENHATLHCWNAAKAIAWSADGAVIVRRTSGDYIVVVSAGAGASYTGFTFDGEGTAKYGFYETSTSINGKTLTNCTISSVTTNALKADGYNYSLTGCTLTAVNPVAGKISTSTLTLCTITGTQSLLTVSSGSSGNVTLTSCTLIANPANSLYNVVYLRASGNYTFTGNTITWTGAPRTVMTHENGLSGSVTISNNTITGTKSSLADFMFSTSTLTVTVTGNTISRTDATGTNNVLSFTNLTNSPTISNNTIETSSSTGCSLIRVQSTGVECGPPTITGNILKSYVASDQYAIGVGEDNPGAGDRKIDGAVITGNRVYGAKYYNPAASTLRHEIFVGMNANATIARNLVTGGGYGVIIKAEATTVTWTTGGIAYNVLQNCVSESAIHIKGRVADIAILNNTIVTDPSFTLTHPPVYILINGAGNGPSGVVLKNNIIVSGDEALIESDAEFLGEVDYNLYYATGTLDYFGVSSTDFADWQSDGYDAHGVYGDPDFTSSTNYVLQSTSPAIDAGADLGLATDYLGNSIVGAPDIGAYENQTPTPTPSAGGVSPAILQLLGVL